MPLGASEAVVNQSFRAARSTSRISDDITDIEPADITEATYFFTTACRVGLLMNFNVPVLKDGIKRLVL